MVVAADDANNWIENYIHGYSANSDVRSAAGCHNVQFGNKQSIQRDKRRAVHATCLQIPSHEEP